MPSIVVIAELKAATKEARQTIIGALANVGQYSKANEPGVTRWAVFLPRDISNETSIYAIEEYANQAAFEQHMGCKVVTDLIAFFTANGTLFGGEGVITTSETQTAFAKSELATANDPFISYTKIEGGSEKASSAGSENVPGIMALSIAKDKANANTIHIVSIYADEQSAKKNAQTQTIPMKFATGYLIKAEGGPKL
ncbi:hypothetical protein P154DRAFT_563136 [Amniculicola lignicola CBS 123094]|uniref:ABM domain-containing protein n=1 Tax=Amniculicola lignicola CBS 123094 TaxID=1392246 RepID=A0A6A5WKI1_9PLEO|nr:hypothetical protein P154DRAFT_563136 [Amniculicola lignicola CBS 123094]